MRALVVSLAILALVATPASALGIGITNAALHIDGAGMLLMWTPVLGAIDYQVVRQIGNVQTDLGHTFVSLVYDRTAPDVGGITYFITPEDAAGGQFSQQKCVDQNGATVSVTVSSCTSGDP